MVDPKLIGELLGLDPLACDPLFIRCLHTALEDGGISAIMPLAACMRHADGPEPPHSATQSLTSSLGA